MLSPSHTVITYNIPIQGKTLIFFLNQKKEKKKKTIIQGTGWRNSTRPVYERLAWVGTTGLEGME